MYFSKLNSLLILLVSVIALLYALPNAVTKFNFNEISTYLPGKKVNLGLDLKGGSYILLQAEMKTSEIEKLSLEDLQDKLTEFQKQLFDLKLNHSVTVSYTHLRAHET